MAFGEYEEGFGSEELGRKIERASGYVEEMVAHINRCMDSIVKQEAGGGKRNCRGESTFEEYRGQDERKRCEEGK